MKAPSLTIGIEEEYQIIDPQTRELRSYITEILEEGKLLLREQVKMRHREPESHQGDASANPCEKRSLFGEIIPQVSRRLFPDGDIHSWLLTPNDSSVKQALVQVNVSSILAPGSAT